MKKYIVKAEIMIAVTDEDIDDIMCSALEGGITYWADAANVVGKFLGEYASEQISRGGKLKIHTIEPFDEDETEWYVLNEDKLLKGIKMAIEDGYRADYGWYDGGKLDCGQIDAEVADVIVQLGLFGEVIYG